MFLLNTTCPARRHELGLLACALLMLGCTPAIVQTGRQDGITIGIIGDQTGSRDIQASYKVLEDGVAELARQNVDVVLHTGDLLESTRAVDEVRALFQQATGILDRLPVRWYLTAGDHDVDPPLFEQDSSDRSREQLFQQLYGARVPPVLQHPYYSFDAGRYHFIAAYSHESLDADPRFGNIFLAQVYEDQFAFLQQDLEQHRNARAIVVFIHQALWYQAGGWQRVHELLRRYPVKLVISGHHHYDQDYGSLDGIRYITVGATGGATKNGSRDAGNAQHVSVVKLAGPNVSSVNLISLPDRQPLALTPRVDMDRVQALEVQLDNLFNFGQTNPVFLKGSQLVSDCAAATPAKLSLIPLGNPIDLPLDLRLTFTTSPANLVTLVNPAFGAGACMSTAGGLQCTLKRTARTNFSNYSSVQMQGDACVAASCVFVPVTPLWTSGLAPADSGPAAGTLLNLSVRTTFQGQSGTLYLDKNLSTTVQACP